MTAPINIADAHREFDALALDILGILARARDLQEDIETTLTDERKEKGLIVGPQPEVPAIPMLVNPVNGGLMLDEQGSPVERGTPGRPAGWLGPVTDEQWADLQARKALLDTLVKLLDKPVGNAKESFMRQVRGTVRRWSAS